MKLLSFVKTRINKRTKGRVITSNEKGEIQVFNFIGECPDFLKKKLNHA